MLTDYFGCFTLPSAIARNVHNYTPDGLILWWNLDFDCMQFVERIREYNDDVLKRINEVAKNPDEMALIAVDGDSHWVTLEKKDMWGRFIALDPIDGTRINLLSKYTISGCAIFKRKGEPQPKPPMQEEKPTKKLLKGISSPNIYWYNTKEKFLIPDWYTFVELFGPHGGMNAVQTLSDDVLGEIPTGAAFVSVEPTNTLPETFNRKMAHETQGRYPVCIAMSMTRLFEMQYEVARGEKLDLSVKAAYIDAGGHGSGTLSSTHAYRQIAGYRATEGKGFMREKDCPTGDLSDYDPNWIANWKTDVAIADGQRIMPSGYDVLASRVIEADEEMLKRAILEKGGWTVSVDTTINNWDKGEYNGEEFSQNHMVVVTGWDKDNCLGYNHWHEGDSEIKLNKKMPIMWARQFTL
jgi:hypothetical protein